MSQVELLILKHRKVLKRLNSIVMLLPLKISFFSKKKKK